MTKEVEQDDEETISLGISFLSVAGMMDDGLIKALTSMCKRSECSIVGLEELLVNISCLLLPNISIYGRCACLLPPLFEFRLFNAFSTSSTNPYGAFNWH